MNISKETPFTIARTWGVIFPVALLLRRSGGSQKTMWRSLKEGGGEEKESNT